METFWTYFQVLAPSVGVGLVFWLAIRAIFRADRKERAMEAEVRRELAAERPDPRPDAAQAPSAPSPGSADASRA
ncbi:MULTISPECIES: hypothetical protein [Actinomycetes]|uniref:Lysyl-tRNA synthetase n=2 Tax=Actinomycetes TaxID=1760 RepID=A0ABP6LUB0_9MICC|nr:MULTISPECIES: hypothetical protein [unclassified Nesterenkonia]MDS2173270.1 hypothetical protein [Nesterenkonia sp. CL21]OSM42124.1 hypothetical protein BCY76_016370 [Nesterenkonia sp. PF2B19]